MHNKMAGLAWRRTVFFVASFLLLFGCAAPKVAPLTASGNQFGSSADEAKLIDSGKRLHEEFVRKGMLLETEALAAHVERIGRPLVPPESVGIVDIRFHILRTPEVNAYALSNGDIYLSVGLLARLENDAQLAEVIGHEITHVVLRHGLTAMETRRSNIVAAHIADLFLFGTSIAYFPFLASNAHYSREQEQEADKYGMEAIIRAGYDPNEALKIFTTMQEVKKGEEIEGSAYSSHPSNRRREEALKVFLKTKEGDPSNPQGRTGEKEYAEFRGRIMVENIELKLTARQYELAKETAEKAAGLLPDAPWPYFYQGEACRLMADDPKGASRENAWLYGRKDIEAITTEFESKRDENYVNAQNAYLKGLEIDHGFLPAERGLGLVYLKKGDNKTAREHLSRYLAGGNEIKDRQYIVNLMKEISQ